MNMEYARRGMRAGGRRIFKHTRADARTAWGRLCLAFMLCLSAAPDMGAFWGMGSGLVYAREERQDGDWARYSEIYDSPEMIPEPPEEFTDEGGERFRLVSKTLLEVPATGRRRQLSGEVIYREVSRDMEAPQTAQMEVWDEESGKTFEAALPFQSASFEEERWSGDFAFTVTFHTYGADYYRLGELTIPHDPKGPSLWTYRAELLEALGKREEDYRIESIGWDGEAYRDENGILCRDARASGSRRVWDCRAVYAGETALPDYTRYRLLTEYERAGPEDGETAYRGMPGGEPARDAGRIARPGAIPRGASREEIPAWLVWLRRSVGVSFSLLFAAAAIWGFRRLLKLAGRIREERES